MMRNRLVADMEAVERGDDPSGLVRDPAKNECIKWPTATISHYVDPITREGVVKHSAFLHTLLPGMRPEDNFFLIEGQPDHVRAEWDYLRGLTDLRPASLDPSTDRPEQEAPDGR